MAAPELDEVDDDRLRSFADCALYGDGFANNMIWKRELALMAAELLRYRDRPLHCPGCDGDHA